MFTISNIFGCCFIILHNSFLFYKVFNFVDISNRFTCYSRDYDHSFVLLVFWFLFLLESYIYIWIALLSWSYFVLVSVPQEPQEGETRVVSV